MPEAMQDGGGVNDLCSKHCLLCKQTAILDLEVLWWQFKN
jgi:hypothetical protein